MTDRLFPVKPGEALQKGWKERERGQARAAAPNPWRGMEGVGQRNVFREQPSGHLPEKTPQKRNLTLYILLGNLVSRDLVQHRHDQAHGGARTVNHEMGLSKDSLTMLSLISSGYGIQPTGAGPCSNTYMCMCMGIQHTGVHEVRGQLLRTGSLLPSG